MSLFLDIGQGAGVSGATGVRPFLPALLTGALAANDSGVDFDGTDYSFLEKPVFLFVVLALAVAVFALNRRGPQTAGRRPQGGGSRSRERVVEVGSAAIAIVLGALLFAGSLAEDGQTSWWGLPAGLLCAALGYLAVAALFGRARARLASQPDAAGAASLLDVYAEAIALVLAAVAIFVEPVGYVALAAFLFLIVRSRGEGAQKYGGLRILR
jgi:heme/copper-type cytochrome/quinol oxidase subunit 2